MSDRHVIMLAGRVTGDPFPLGDGGSFVTISVPVGAGSRLWGAYRSLGHDIGHALADGDRIAVIGRVNPDRRSPDGLQGPIEVDAVLGLGAAGDIFGSF